MTAIADDGSRIQNREISLDSGWAHRPADVSLDDFYETARTVSTILEARAVRVALQFPDVLLPDAPDVVWRLQCLLDEGRSGGAGDCATSGDRGNKEEQEVGGEDDEGDVLLFVLGDTSHGESSVDHVAAQHLDAQLLVHYGRAALSALPANCPPVIFVLGTQHLDKPRAAAALAAAIREAEEAGASDDDDDNDGGGGGGCGDGGNAGKGPIVVVYDAVFHLEMAEVGEELRVATNGRPVLVGRLPAWAASPEASAVAQPRTSATCGASSATPAAACCSAASPCQAAAATTAAAVTSAAPSSSSPPPPPPSQPAPPTGLQPPLEAARPASSVPPPVSVPPTSPSPPLMLAGLVLDALELRSLGGEVGPGDEQGSELDGSCGGGGGSGGGSEALLQRAIVCYVGPDGPPLAALLLRCGECRTGHVVHLDPCLGAGPSARGGAPEYRARAQAARGSRALKRRHFLVQKAAVAGVIGIVVATLGVASYSEVVARLRALIEGAGRTAYTFAVGKVNPYKLANFAEVEAYVLVAGPEDSLLDASEYHVPVITPFEVGGREKARA